MKDYAREVRIAREQLVSSKKFYINKLVEWYKNTYAIDSDFQDVCTYINDISLKTAYFFNGVNKYKEPIFIIMFDDNIKGAITQIKKLERMIGFYYYFYDKVITSNGLTYQFEGGSYHVK
jgi:hypothetical protein